MAPIRIGPDGKIKEIKIGVKNNEGKVENRKIIKGYIGTANGNRLFFQDASLYAEFTYINQTNTTVTITSSLNESQKITKGNSYTFTGLKGQTTYTIESDVPHDLFIESGLPDKGTYSNNNKVYTFTLSGQTTVTNKAWTLAISSYNNGASVSFDRENTPSPSGAEYTVTYGSKSISGSNSQTLLNSIASYTTYSTAETTVSLKITKSGYTRTADTSVVVKKNILTVTQQANNFIKVTDKESKSITYTYKKSGNTYSYTGPFNPFSNSNNYTEEYNYNTFIDRQWAYPSINKDETLASFQIKSDINNNNTAAITGSLQVIAKAVIVRTYYDYQRYYNAQITFTSTGSSQYLKDTLIKSYNYNLDPQGETRTETFYSDIDVGVDLGIWTMGFTYSYSSIGSGASTLVGVQETSGTTGQSFSITDYKSNVDLISPGELTYLALDNYVYYNIDDPTYGIPAGGDGWFPIAASGRQWAVDYGLDCSNVSLDNFDNPAAAYTDVLIQVDNTPYYPSDIKERKFTNVRSLFAYIPGDASYTSKSSAIKYYYTTAPNTIYTKQYKDTESGWIEIPLSAPIVLTNIQAYECLAGDTLITMADNTHKRIDTLSVGDKILAIDPETGDYVEDTITYSDATINKSHSEYTIYTFSDDSFIKVVHRHRLYNIDKQEMVYMHEWAIGERAYREDGKIVELASIEEVKEQVYHYTIFTEKQNYFANGFLAGNRNTQPITIQKTET